MISVLRFGWRHPVLALAAVGAVTAWWWLGRRANPELRAEARQRFETLTRDAGDQAEDET